MSFIPGVDAAVWAAAFAGWAALALLDLPLPAVEGATVVALLPFDITSGGTLGVGGDAWEQKDQ